MADTTTIIQAGPGYQIENEAPAPSSLWHRLALVGVMLISVFMNFYQLGQNGFGNTYYAAGDRSMLDSLHNFFFVSYDPGGFVTIDKPPLGFWLQVGSAKLFGFTPFSVLLPQALAGVLSVLLLYYLVRRHFGVVAGIIAALALAISPISVVTNRNITIDSTLALVLLLGAWAVMRAAETGKLRWLLLCAVFVGLGFNVKMLEAYLVVPAFGLLYLLASPRSLWMRIGHLALAGVLLLAISLSWAVAVDLTPASQRPYVGSSQDNSEISLAFGYNGIDRLLGAFGRGPRLNNAPRTSDATSNGGPVTGTPPPNANDGFSGFGSNGASPQPPGGGPGGGGMFGTGTPGPLRLFGQELGGQIAWFLPLAILGAVALAWQRRPRPQSDVVPRFIAGNSLILWGMWLLTMGIFFSVAGFFHQYYLTEMAPAIAALVGIGIVVMWQDYRRSGWRGWLLPLAIIATVAEQIYLLKNYPTWGQWLIPLMIVLGAIAVVVLVAARLAPYIHVNVPSTRILVSALVLGMLAFMLTPTVWAAIPVIQDTTAQLPVAGPSQIGNFAGNPDRGRSAYGRDLSLPGVGGNFGGNNNANVNMSLINYLEANQGSATYLVATPSSMTADGIILATNKPVMALGGFSGSDPILTTDQLATLVSQGTVRFFLFGSFGPGQQLPPQVLDRIPEQFRDRLRNGSGGGGFGQQGALTTWVTQHCSVVPASKWQSSSTNPASGGFGPGGASQLYDCATTH
jgi:4-amino-4-deoxy-L-arabinose transferase-like glycosyltransferase